MESAHPHFNGLATVWRVFHSFIWRGRRMWVSWERSCAAAAPASAASACPDNGCRPDPRPPHLATAFCGGASVERHRGRLEPGDMSWARPGFIYSGAARAERAVRRRRRAAAMLSGPGMSARERGVQIKKSWERRYRPCRTWGRQMRCDSSTGATAR